MEMRVKKASASPARTLVALALLGCVADARWALRPNEGGGSPEAPIPCNQYNLENYSFNPIGTKVSARDVDAPP